MRIIIIFLFICRYLYPVDAQAAYSVMGSRVIVGICSDTTGLTGVNTGTLWLSECTKKYIDYKMADTATNVTTALSNKVPNVRTMTVNGITYDMSANRTWTLKMPVAYTATTNASGIDTVTYTAAFSAAPNVQVAIKNQTLLTQRVRVYNISTTGCRVHVWQINSVNLLGVDVLLSTTTNINAATVSVLVTEN